MKAGFTKSENSVIISTQFGTDNSNNQSPIFSHWVNIETAMTYSPMTYTQKIETFFILEVANSEFPENKNANIGQANANVN